MIIELAEESEIILWGLHEKCLRWMMTSCTQGVLLSWKQTSLEINEHHAYQSQGTLDVKLSFKINTDNGYVKKTLYSKIRRKKCKAYQRNYALSWLNGDVFTIPLYIFLVLICKQTYSQSLLYDSGRLRISKSSLSLCRIISKQQANVISIIKCQIASLFTKIKYPDLTHKS